MCLNCLQNNLSQIESYEREMNEHVATIHCKCCKSYSTFLLDVNADFKVLCLTKMKKQEQVCPNGIRYLIRFENSVKQNIKNKLVSAIEHIDEIKEDLHDSSYVDKMNEIKSLNDYVQVLDDAEHR